LALAGHTTFLAEANVNPQPFASSTASIVLAWLLVVPVLLGMISGAYDMLFGKIDEGVPRWFLRWTMLCLIVLSPFRYMVLQTLIATAYPVQSISVTGRPQ
jgi:hypothetical protein